MPPKSKKFKKYKKRPKKPRKVGKQLPIKGDTIVGNDVWIGRRATIMPGVHISDGAIISADAVVVRDVEPYTIVGGNPGREIRKRFSPEVIQELLDIKWWDFDIELINQYIGAIVSGDLDTLRKIKKQP